MGLSPRYLEFLRSISRQIQEAQKSVRILRALDWPEQVEREFFAKGAQELPNPSYPLGADFAVARKLFLEIREQLQGETEIERFLRDTCESYATAAEMLAVRGQRGFYGYSCEIYGRPGSTLIDKKTTNLALARHFEAVITQYAERDLGSSETQPVLDAEQVAEELSRRFGAFFKEHPVRVELDPDIAANAMASADVVRIKKGALFSRKDLAQLECHEGHVHLATTLNGRAQPLFPFLASGAPRTTSTQEGLATFTEFISHSIDLERVRRLTDRILAIHMSEEGADFLDLYRFFLDHGHVEAQAFDCARRVVRGGLVEGGGPFTKDVCYLDGLLKVSNFLRHAIIKGHPEFVPLLFVGKLDLEDIPLLAHLSREGWLEMPRYMPWWARDLGSLTAFMSYSTFFEQTDLRAEHRYYDQVIERAASDWPS